MARKPTAGVGSNQYVSRGTSNAVQPAASRRDLKKALETESVAWAFDPAAQDESGDWTKMAARSRTEADQMRLAGHPDPGVRLALAKSKQAKPAVLERLAADQDRDVKLAVIVNPSTPPPAFATMAADPDEYVTTGLARSELTPPDVLHHIVQNAKTDVAQTAAANPNCPVEDIIAMAKSSEPVSVHMALRNPSCPEHVLRSEYPGNERSVICNPACPPDLLQYLADDGWDSSQSSSFASNPNCPPKVLAQIVEDWQLGNSVYKAEEALRNPAMAAEDLERFSKFHTTPANNGVQVRKAVLANPSCPDPVVLDRALHDPDGEVRRVAVMHPRCPAETVRYTALHDHSAAVRIVAIRRLPDDVELFEHLQRRESSFENRQVIAKRLNRIRRSVGDSVQQSR